MMKLLARWLISAAAIYVVPYLVPGVFIADHYTAILAALVIGLVNLVIRPILLFLTFPITILTLGLSTLLINTLMFWIASNLVRGFTVDGFVAAFFGALAFWVIAWIGNAMVGTRKVDKSISR